MVVDSRENKRRRESGCSTPALMASPSNVMMGAFRAVRRDHNVNSEEQVEESNPRPAKRCRKEETTINKDRVESSRSKKTPSSSFGTLSPSSSFIKTPPVSSDHDRTPILKNHEDDKDEPASINSLPVDTVANILSFLGTTEDRSKLQNTSKLFRKLSNADSMLKNIDVGGDPETGKGGIIQEHDTPAAACTSLTIFANAGNVQAQYMYVLLSQLFVTVA